MIVVDSKECETASDENTVAYIQIPEYDGMVNYSNLAILKKGLTDYRK